MSARIDPPLALLAELTHRCPLRCPYCSNPIEPRTRGERAERRRMAPRLARSRFPRRAAGSFLGRRADGASRSRGADRRGQPARPLRKPDHLWHAGRRTRARSLRTSRAEARAAQLPGCRARGRRPYRGPRRRARKEDQLRGRRSRGWPAAHAEYGRASPEPRPRAGDDRHGAGAGRAAVGDRACAVLRLGLDQPRRPAAQPPAARRGDSAR